MPLVYCVIPNSDTHLLPINLLIVFFFPEHCYFQFIIFFGCIVARKNLKNVFEFSNMWLISEDTENGFLIHKLQIQNTDSSCNLKNIPFISGNLVS